MEDLLKEIEARVVVWYLNAKQELKRAYEYILGLLSKCDKSSTGNY